MNEGKRPFKLCEVFEIARICERVEDSQRRRRWIQIPNEPDEVTPNKARASGYKHRSGLERSVIAQNGC
jgi:hypothetical protein